MPVAAAACTHDLTSIDRAPHDAAAADPRLSGDIAQKSRVNHTWVGRGLIHNRKRNPELPPRGPPSSLHIYISHMHIRDKSIARYRYRSWSPLLDRYTTIERPLAARTSHDTPHSGAVREYVIRTPRLQRRYSYLDGSDATHTSFDGHNWS